LVCSAIQLYAHAADMLNQVGRLQSFHREATSAERSCGRVLEIPFLTRPANQYTRILAETDLPNRLALLASLDSSFLDP
jgi:hypothetical protein